jgi:hypothetical protein
MDLDKPSARWTRYGDLAFRFGSDGKTHAVIIHRAKLRGDLSAPPASVLVRNIADFRDAITSDRYPMPATIVIN